VLGLFSFIVARRFGTVGFMVVVVVVLVVV
jgi:hypothetical protein